MAVDSAALLWSAQALSEAEQQMEAEKAAAWKRGVDERDAQAKHEAAQLQIAGEVALSEVSEWWALACPAYARLHMLKHALGFMWWFGSCASLLGAAWIWPSGERTRSWRRPRSSC